jgi:carbon-monoxide dehydrogenase medium subunit
MLMMKAQLFSPDCLVSLKRLRGVLAGISLSGDGSFIRVGGATTFAEIEQSDLFAEHFPSVVAAMKTLANVRVRNVATVGGNLAYADPHLDLPPIWTSLGARVRIRGAAGERVLPVGELILGYYETALADGELISEIEVPLRSGWVATYVKITTRAAHDWPTIGISVAADINAGRIRDIAVVLSAAVDRPTRLSLVEKTLCSGPVTDELLERVGQAVSEEVELQSDDRGSSEYKTHLLRVHLQRTIRALVGQGERAA